MSFASSSVTNGLIFSAKYFWRSSDSDCGWISGGRVLVTEVLSLTKVKLVPSLQGSLDMGVHVTVPGDWLENTNWWYFFQIRDGLHVFFKFILPIICRHK